MKTIPEKTKELFAKIGMEFEPVAIKFCYSVPEGYDHVDEVLSFCQFQKKAQTEKRAFYITKEDDDCFGKMCMGMIEKPALGASGQAGYDFGCFNSPAANARLYLNLTTLTPGAVNFVLFSPLSICDFYPDLIVCVATAEQGDILMRATSYYTGEIWESRATCIIGCNWLYSYPYESGKVNYLITGLGHGMKRRKIYPAGRMMISIPYQKFPEVFQALEEMDWELIAMKDDEESKAELARRIAKWQEMSPDMPLKK